MDEPCSHERIHGHLAASRYERAAQQRGLRIAAAIAGVRKDGAIDFHFTFTGSGGNIMKAYLETYDTVLKEQNSDFNGISSQEAGRRLEQFGKNRLKEGKQKTLLQRFLKQLADPMIIILIAAAVVSAITAAYSGESFADVIIIVAVVLINAVLGVVQENKAEQAIAALQEIAAATSKVLRDGQQHTVRSEELVPGDVIILEAGDAVPADARLLECASMKAEEAPLTGESVPVNKTADVLTCDDQKTSPSATGKIWFIWAVPLSTDADVLS